jgi:hypothetical protein
MSKHRYIGLDPGQARAFAAQLRRAGATAESLSASAARSASAVALGASPADELDTVAALWRALATDLEHRSQVASDLVLTLPGWTALAPGLATSSGTGPVLACGLTPPPAAGSVPDGRDLLVELRAGLALITAAVGTTNGAGLTMDDLVAAAALPDLPVAVRSAIQALIDSPGLFAAVAWSLSSMDSIVGGRGSLTAAGIDAAIAQLDVARLLSDPAIFQRLDRAVTGEIDGIVSRDDIAVAIDNHWFGASKTEALLSMIGPEGWFDRVAGTDDRAMDGPFASGRLAWTDVASLAIRLHAFGGDSRGARRFLTHLPSAADDVSGRTHGFDIRLSSDDGVRSLATAALDGLDDLSAQVNVVASLPESPGGVRNSLITLFYGELAGEMNRVLNQGHVADINNPVLAGHSGANWALMAPWASDSIRGPLRGEPVSILGISMAPSVGDRQHLADGNQYIFGDIAPRFAAVIEAADSGHFATAATTAQWFATATTAAGGPLFGPGYHELRDAMAHYAAAITETDPVERQRLVFGANSLAAIHEQAGVQRHLAALTDFGVSDDGVVRGILGELGASLVGGDALIATSIMTLKVGVDAPLLLDLDRDLDPGWFDTTNNMLVSMPLADALNPALRPPVSIGGVELELDKLSGWHHPDAATGMQPFETSVLAWLTRGTGGHIIVPASGTGVVLSEPVGSSAASDLTGTQSIDWGEPNDRMWFIANLFQQTHSDPILWDQRQALGIYRSDNDGGMFDWLPPSVIDGFQRRSVSHRSPQG